MSNHHSSDIITQQPQQVAQFSAPGWWLSIGWIPPGGLSFDDWLSIGPMLGTMKSSIHIWLGDWLNFGERAYGETYAQAIDETGFVYGTLATDAYVMSRVPISLRDENLTFSHYKAVAPLADVEERGRWLALAAEGDNGKRWSVRKLKEEIERDRSGDNGNDPPPPPDVAALLAENERLKRAVAEAAAVVADKGMSEDAFDTLIDLAAETAPLVTVCPACGYRW